MNTTPLTIIGGGPAGLSAACEVARAGVKCVLVEETDRIGGKVLHHVGTGSTDAEADLTAKRLQAELDTFDNDITIIRNARVWSVDANHTVSIGHARNPQLGKEGKEGVKVPTCLFSDKVIIAGGALERVLPFPGWTLPGVMTLGAANTLVNQGVSPGNRMLVAGSGPLLLLLAANLLKAGVTLTGVVQLKSTFEFFRYAVPLVRGAFSYKLQIALQAAMRMIGASVPLLNGSMVVDVTGEDGLKNVRVASVNSQTGQVDTNLQREFEVDTLSCSYGLIPNTDITHVAGCWHVYDDPRGYWRVCVTSENETSVPGIFAAGDCVLVRGYTAASLEGRLAAVGALAQLGAISSPEAEKRGQRLKRALRNHNAFGRALDSISRPHPAILKTLPEETCICRCEEITLADIRVAHASGAVDINDVKRRTRLGMGHCQGRFCGQVINEVLAQFEGRLDSRGTFTPRMPVRPITFEDMAR